MIERFVVTGTGHSGTAWLARALSLAGIATTHEGVFTLAGPYFWPAMLEGDVSLAAAPHLHRPGFDVVQVALVVRDPLAVLNSFYRGYKFADSCPCHGTAESVHLRTPFAQYVFQHADIYERGDELGTNIRYVARWTALAERVVRTPRRYRIEDLTAGDFPTFAHQLAGVPLSVGRAVLEGPWLNTDINAHGSPDDRPWVSWDEVCAHPDGASLVLLARDYGYLD